MWGPRWFEGPFFTRRTTTLIVLSVLFIFAYGTFVYTRTKKQTQTFFSKVVYPKYYDKSRHDFGSKEIRHVAFLKVHKTASSTTTNILLRFGESRNLTFILGTKPTTEVSQRNTISKGIILPPPPGKHFDIFCLHALYNASAFKMFLHQDTVIIGSVREPYSRFKSAVRFFSNSFTKRILSIPCKNPIGAYLDNPFTYESIDPRKSMVNNRMAVEFGFPVELFPGHSNKILTTKTDEYIQKLEKEIALILVAEYYDESLVLMRRLLKWSLKDILYSPFHVHKKSKADGAINKLTQANEEKFRSFSYLDYRLYNFSVNRLMQQMKNAGDDFRKEVTHFKEIRNLVSTFCRRKIKSGNNLLQVEESPWNKKFGIGKYNCLLYEKAADKFIQIIRRRQYTEH